MEQIKLRYTSEHIIAGQNLQGFFRRIAQGEVPETSSKSMPISSDFKYGLHALI